MIYCLANLLKLLIMGRAKSYVRDELLEKAMYVFWDKGYFRTSMSDLATATQVDKKCLFREFVNKEKMFEEVLDLYCSWDRKHFEAVLNKKPLGIENIKRFLDGLKLEHSDSIKGCLLNKSIIQRNLITENHFEIIKKSLSHLENLLLNNIQVAKDKNDIKNSSSAAELAKYLIYTTQGINCMSLFESKEGNVEQVINSILIALE